VNISLRMFVCVFVRVCFWVVGALLFVRFVCMFCSTFGGWFWLLVLSRTAQNGMSLKPELSCWLFVLEGRMFCWFF